MRMKWWSENGDVFSGVGVMVKEHLCTKVVDVRMVSDGVMVIVLVVEDDLWVCSTKWKALERKAIVFL